MQKIREKEKDVKTRRRKEYKWIIFGVLVVICIIVGVLICVIQSFGLKGVSFSVESGFYDDNIDLEIKSNGILLTQPISVKYNMNGDDLENTSELYDEIIKLEVPEEGYKLYTVTASACKEDGECTDPEVATYVLGKNLDEDVTIDIVNINSSQKNLYDYDVGIMVGGRTYDENEMTENNGYVMGNYNNRGKKWMREAYIIRFDNNRRVIWDEDVYIGISGGTSSAYDVKSFKVSMGLNSEKNDASEKTFRLRSGSQDQFGGNIRSSVVDRLAEESGFDGRTGTKRVAVFLNGEYNGVFDMQDVFSEQGLSQKFGLEKEKKVIKASGSEKEVFKSLGLEEYYWDNLDSSENREKLEELVDMENYLKYYAIFVLANNTDWPMNNFEAWRYKDERNTNNKYEDGRVRFLISDTDLIYYTEGNIVWFEGVIGDIFEYLMEGKNNGAGSSFRKVMESEYYREKFIGLLRELMKGPFKTENILKIIDEEVAKIEHQVKLFSSEGGYEDWIKQIGLLKKAVLKREGEIRADVQKYFGVKL